MLHQLVPDFQYPHVLGASREQRFQGLRPACLVGSGGLCVRQCLVVAEFCVLDTLPPLGFKVLLRDGWVHWHYA